MEGLVTSAGATANTLSSHFDHELAVRAHEHNNLAIVKVLHILWQMDIGGAERAVYQLVREQRRRGVEADVMLGRNGGFYGERSAEAGAKVFELGQRSTFDFSVAKNATRIMGGYDILHFHSAEVGLTYLSSRVPSVRCFYTHRGGVFRYPLKQALRYRLVGYYFRRTFEALSGNTTQGAVAASRLFGIPHAEIPTTYNGIDFSLLDPRRSRDEVLAELGGSPGDGIVRIGTSANLRPWKRIELLVESMVKLRERPVHCYIIGEGPSQKSLEELARARGIAEMITFTGRKEHIGDYLQALDIFVLPSGPEESFGNSAVEAMGVGVPTIVFSDGGGLVEHVEHGKTGYLVDDVGQLAAALDALVGDPQLRQSIGEAGRRAMHEKYSLRAMVERYSLLYQGRKKEIAIPVKH